MKTRLWLVFGMTFLFFLSSCNDEKVISNNQLVRSISVTGQDFVDGDGVVATRASYSVDGTGFHFTWTQGDTVGIYPIGGDQVAFPISSGAGGQTAQFDGGAWALRSSYSYAAYYPFSPGNYHIKETSIPVSYIGQFQNGNGSLDGFDKFDYQSSVATSPDADGNVFISLKHLGCFVRLQMEMPVADSYSLLSLSLDKGSFITEGTVDLSSDNPSITSSYSSNKYNVSLSNISSTDDNKIITIYMMLAPTDLSESTITATLSGTKYATYSASFTGKNMEVGKAYSYTVKTNKGTTIGGEDIEWGDNGFILASSISLNKTGVSLLPGAEIEIEATILPEATTDKTIQWSSNDTLVATVVNGIVIAKAPGLTSISASSIDGSNKTASCSVEVKEPTFVDLGLPSGSLWASCNVGASLPKEFGYCYSWGGLIKGYFNKIDHPAHYDNSGYYNDYNFTKYNTIDNKYVLDPEDDVATVLWGDDWQMPTMAQFQELLNTSYTSVTYNLLDGVEGFTVTSKKNGKSIFLPAYDCGNNSYTVEYYSRERHKTNGTCEARGIQVLYYNGKVELYNSGSFTRDHSYSIRPIKKTIKHEYVDLGLSVKWATCNVGATKPEEYGDYYAWGETEPKTSYTWTNYKFRTSGDSWDNVKFSKYNTSTSYGTVDNKTVLDPEDDVAHVKWGGSWRLPTKEEQDDLRNKCTWTWYSSGNTEFNGVAGYKVTSNVSGYTDRSIFLPAAGSRYASSLDFAGENGYSWSSSLGTGTPGYARSLNFGSGSRNTHDSRRLYGQSVRPVCP